MDKPQEDLMQLYEELTEWREKAREIGENEEDATAPLLKDLTDLAGSVLHGLKDIDKAAKTICNEVDNICLNDLEAIDTLHVGRNSVKPLLEVTKTATKVFAAVKENNSDFKEELDLEPAYQQLEQLKSNLRRNDEFVQYLRATTEGLRKIIKNSNKCLDPSVSSASVSGSEPSGSGFNSFLENTMITSSPLPLKMEH